MNEKELMQGLIDAATASGWLVYHTHDSRRSAPGFPDLVMVNGGRGQIAFIECKAEKGRLTEAQKRWILAIEACNVLPDLPEIAVGGRPWRRVDVGVANPDTYDSWLGYILGSRVPA